MNCLIDCCIEADCLMFKHLAEELQRRGHQVLVTARRPMANLFCEYIGLPAVAVGDYGYTREEKLEASANRVLEMVRCIRHAFTKLDGIVGNTSIEAARVGFGLGVPVHTFHDHPNPEARHQMRLTIPLSTYVYAPWIIPKENYLALGVEEEQVVSYRGFLALAWLPYVQLDEKILSRLGLDPDRPVVVFRESEVAASYLTGKRDITLPAIKRLAHEMPYVQFAARPRYNFEDLWGYFVDTLNVRILEKPVHMQSLLAKACLLVGGGATMCLEAAYYGTPVIACRPIKAPITDFLIGKSLAWKAQSVGEVVSLARGLMSIRTALQAKEVYGRLKFPVETLIRNLEEGSKT